MSIRPYKIACIISILLIAVPVSLAEEENDREANWVHAKNINEQSITWVSHYNGTIRWGDRINIDDWTLGNFTIELTDLMKDTTGSKIIGSLMTVTIGDKKSTVMINSDESEIVTFDAPFYDDEMKIYANISGERTWSRELLEPDVSIQVFLRDKPEINMSYKVYNEDPRSNASISASDYIKSNKMFYIQISLENKGNVSLMNALLDVNLTDFTIPQKQLSEQKQGMSFKQVGNSIIYNLNELKANETRIINLSMIAPISPVNKTFPIPLRLSGRDNKDVEYIHRAEEQILVKPFIEINKQIGSYINYTSTEGDYENVLYLNEFSKVFLYIKNNGDQATVINLIDYVPDNFEYKTEDNKSLNWTITIPAESSDIITYSIRPIKYKPNLIIPVAIATFEFDGKNYSVDSDDIDVKIKGADVSLTKDVKVNQQSNGIINATITIHANNQGDQRVSINIADRLPDNAGLINGTTSRDNIFLEKDELYSYSYEISIPFEERIVLPAAKGYFIDFRGFIEKDSRKGDYRREIESNQPVIESRPPAPESTPEDIGQETLEKITNTTLSSKVEKEDIKTKLEIIKEFILKLLNLILGNQKEDR